MDIENVVVNIRLDKDALRKKMESTDPFDFDKALIEFVSVEIKTEPKSIPQVDAAGQWDTIP